MNVSESTEQNLSAPIEQSQEVETAAPSENAEAKEGIEAPKEGEDQAGEQQETPKAKVSGASKKIGKLTRKLTQSQSEIEYLRAQLDKLNAPKQAEPSKDTAKEAKGEPNPNDFETHAEYVRAIVKYENEQVRKAEREESSKQQQRSEFEKRQQTFQEKAQAFAKEHPDYLEALDAVDEIRLSFTVQNAILKHGPELAYELAKNPDELARICGLDAIDAAEEIGEIRARLKAAKPVEQTLTKTTQAPKPTTPLAGKAAPARKSLSDENLSFKEYVAMRRDAQRKR